MFFKELGTEAFFVLWLFLPAGIANMVPVFLARVPILSKWNTPLDFGVEWRGIRLLGDHKTVRGLVGGAVTGGIVCYVQSLFITQFLPFNPFVFGVILGMGALLGDAIKSFLKRQIGIASGASWFPFDQIDYILGAILITLPLFKLTVLQYILAILIWFSLHLLTVVIGYLLRIRKDVI
jgi:CDP-2,3-bis-(O-geranylgeranyl)-sn-glycerol synthase